MKLVCIVFIVDGVVTVLVDICVKYFIVDGMVIVLVDICVKSR